MTPEPMTSEPMAQGVSPDLVATSFLNANQLPLVVTPRQDGVDLFAWSEGHRAWIAEQLGVYGGILFRGFEITTPDAFETWIRAAVGSPLNYTERSSPRSQVKGKIYTSTDYPPDQSIFLHNEQSYNLIFPTKIAFCCLQPAVAGGETPIADSRRILQQLHPDVRARFAREGYLYVRNIDGDFGLSWQQVFQTEERSAVEAYCQENHIAFEWLGESHLRTRQLRRALAKHPTYGTETWFNHLTFFHVTSLEPLISEMLLLELAEEDLPNNTYYADGSAIEPEVMEHLQGLYEKEKILFPWQKGDVLLLDNMLVAHGRSPFKGPRKVVVGMADPVPWEACQA